MRSEKLWLVASVMALLLAISCGKSVYVVPETSPAARAAVDRLLILNQGLLDFKGIGQMKLIHSGRIQSARMAWAGTFPDKLRMDILATPGVPLATLTSDGRWIYLRLDQEKRFYKRKNGTAVFQKMVDIPINVLEINQILGGKIPISPHQSAALIECGAGYTLEFRDGTGRICQRIFVDSQKNRPVGFELVKPNGMISYRAEFVEMMNSENFSVPKYLVLSNPKGERFELKVDRYWVNKPLPSSRYVLQPRK